MRGPDGVDDELLIRLGEGGGGGEADAATIQILGDFTSDALCVGKQGLDVHGAPDGSGFDVGPVEVSDEVGCRHAEPGFIDEEATEPPAVEGGVVGHGIRFRTRCGTGCVRLGFDAGDIGKRLSIAVKDGAPLPDTEGKHFELSLTMPAMTLLIR